MKAQSKSEVVQEIWIDASPKTVFSFFTDPNKMMRWMGKAVEIDPRPGGMMRVDIDGKHIERGQFIEVDPPERLVYTSGWENNDELPPGSTQVEVRLLPEQGGTRVHIRQTGLPSIWVEEHRQGWEHYLLRLQIVAAGGDPGPDPWAQEVQS